jgi:hypothetical protein
MLFVICISFSENIFFHAQTLFYHTVHANGWLISKLLLSNTSTVILLSKSYTQQVAVGGLVLTYPLSKTHGIHA